METIYLDSSVPSAFYDERVLWRQEYTQNWWQNELPKYQVFISPTVIAEIAETRNEERREQLFKLVIEMPQLEITKEIERIAEGYLEQQIIPKTYTADAFHIAIASFHKIDFLITWNCSHMADGHRRKRVRLFNTSAGLYVPELLTPLELSGGENNVV
jgi:predicted nucleic acid-binding protein